MKEDEAGQIYLSSVRQVTYHIIFFAPSYAVVSGAFSIFLKKNKQLVSAFLCCIELISNVFRTS